MSLRLSRPISAEPGVEFEEGDLDIASVDSLIFYVIEQPSLLTEELFDPTCPDGPPMEFDPELELDASDELFVWDFLQLASREARQGDVPIAWSMHVSIRASDTLFMTQWALTAHALTGDQQYLDFLENMMSEIDYWAVLNTYGAIQLPKMVHITLWTQPRLPVTVQHAGTYPPGCCTGILGCHVRSGSGRGA